MKNIILLLLIVLGIYSCTKEVPCTDSNVQMIFTAFNSSDLDTIVLRKFKAADQYHHLIDTVNIIYDSTVYLRSNDTTFVFLNSPIQGMKVNFDWQIAIPAINKTVFISDINSEQNTTKCGTLGEPVGCGCINKIYSLKMDNVFIDLSNLDQYQAPYHVYIHK